MILGFTSELRVMLVPLPSRNVLTGRSKAVLLLWILVAICFMFCLCHTILSVPGSLVATCWKRADLLALLCVMFSWWFCHFPIWSPGSGVVLDCFASRSLPSSLLFMPSAGFVVMLFCVLSGLTVF